MSILKILWFILGYFACGTGYYLLLIYLEINEIIDEWGPFGVSDGYDAFGHIVAWPLSVIGLGISILMDKCGELHEKIYEKMLEAKYEKENKKK